MDVQAPKARQIQDRLAEDLAKGGDDDQVRGPVPHDLRGIGGPQAVGLENGQAHTQGSHFYRRRSQGSSATGGSIGLRHDANDLVGLGERPQAGDREVGRTHEDEAHGTYGSTAGGSAQCNRARPAVL